MNKFQLRLRVIAVVFLVLGATFCFAKPPFLKVFLNTYKIDPNSALGKARCVTCHMDAGPPKLNPYGTDVSAALQAAHQRMVTPEMLKSIEKKDSDGDGFTNIEEIRDGTLPGDKNSKPTKSTKPKKSKKSAALEQPGYTFLGAALVFASIFGLAVGRRR